MERLCIVQMSRFAEKQAKRIPKNITKSLEVWINTIEIDGILAMRKIPGYHDEPLKGDRQGQRSSRLNRSYRVIYEELDDGELVVIGILEVNKHVY